MFQYFNLFGEFIAIEILINKYGSMIDFVESEIVPYDDPNAFFIDPLDRDKYKRKYVAFMQRIQDMIRLFHSVEQKAMMSKESLEEIN